MENAGIGEEVSSPESVPLQQIFVQDLYDPDSDPEYDSEEEDFRLYTASGPIKINATSVSLRSESDPEDKPSQVIKEVMSISSGNLIINTDADYTLQVKTEHGTIKVSDVLYIEHEDDDDDVASSRILYSHSGRPTEIKVIFLLTYNSSPRFLHD